MLPGTHFYSWYSYSWDSRFIPGITVIPSIIHSSFQEPAPGLFCQDAWIFALFFSDWFWTDTESRSLKSQKKRTQPISAILTEQAWPIMNLFYGKRALSISGTQQVGIPEWGMIAPSFPHGSQSQRRIWISTFHTLALLLFCRLIVYLRFVHYPLL